jgi:hypothetical protein
MQSRSEEKGKEGKGSFKSKYPETPEQRSEMGMGIYYNTQSQCEPV